jgi:hypothetical protein
VSKFDMLKCLENSINKGSCENGSPSNHHMLFSDKNSPILEILIDNELTTDESEQLRECPSLE